MRKIFTYMFFILLVKNVAYAQAPVIQWEKSYGGTLNDDGRSVDFTNDGGYITAGITNSSDADVSFNHGGSDYWVMRTKPLGTLQWQISLGGSADDSATTVRQTADGGSVVAGWTKSNDGDVTQNRGNKDWWIVKLNSTGSAIGWSKTYGGSQDDEARDILETPDGGYIAVGYTFSNDLDVTGNHGGADVWVVKIDSVGTIEWQKTFGGSSDEFGTRIIGAADGGYLVTALSASVDGDVVGNHGLLDIWLVKINDSGTVIEWSDSYGGSLNDRPGSVRVTPDGGYIMIGTTRSDDGDVSGNHGMFDGWLVKLDSLGVLLWQKTLGGSLSDRGNSVCYETDGSYTALVNTESNDGDVTGNHGGWDIWLVRLDSSGTIIQWQQTFGGSGDERGHSFLQLPAGGYVTLGVSNSIDGDVSGNNGADDFWLIKLLFQCPAGTVTATISGDTTICLGAPVPLVLTFTGTAPWIFSINGSSPLMTSDNPDTIYVSPSGNSVYTLSYAFDAACADSGIVSGSAAVTLNGALPFWTPFIASSVHKACNGTVGLLTTNAAVGQTGYRWSGYAGTEFSNNAGGPFTAGPFETTIPQVYIQYGALPGHKSGYRNCVEVFNDCGVTPAECVWVRGTTSVPAPISGSAIACPNDALQYDVPVPGGADTLLWTFSVPGATITPVSPTANQVIVNFPPGFTVGNLCVSAALSCLGTSVTAERCMTISNHPSIPGVISGTFTACPGDVNTYSIDSVPGAINYTWTALPGILFNGNPSPYITSDLTVDASFPPGFIYASNICVTANGTCGSSSSRCKSVHSLVPATPGNITSDPLSFCSGAPVSFFIDSVSGATSYNWIVSNGTINSGQGTDSINVTWGTGTGLVRVTASNFCGTSDLKTEAFSSTCREEYGQPAVVRQRLTVYPNPAHDKLVIDFQGERSGNYSVFLYDITGRVCFSESIISVQGINRTVLNVSGYSKGTYLLELRSGEESIRRNIAIE